jgi:broad specificity phosphatase PhoE
MTTLYLIRHGQASFGDENYDRLSKRGFRQMKILGAHLMATGCQIDAIYSGPLERQKSSADEVIRHGRELGCQLPERVIRPDLSEYDYQAVLSSQLPDMVAADPSIEEKLKNIYTDGIAFQKVFEGAIVRWVSGQFDKPGVDTWADFLSNVHQALSDIASMHEDRGSVLVFTSGGVITASLQMALKLTGQRATKVGWQLVNASVTRFTCREKQLTLTGFNDIAHLELTQNKSLITYR